MKLSGRETELAFSFLLHLIPVSNSLWLLAKFESLCGTNSILIHLQAGEMSTQILVRLFIQSEKFQTSAPWELFKATVFLGKKKKKEL